MPGPPYPPQGAQLGGVPTVPVDVPISAVLLLIFVLLGATHMTIFQRNRKKDHKFMFSGAFFGLSLARNAALVMRIVWATRPTNVSVAIAANILTQAGVVILFIANLFFAQRIIRAYHPVFGWHMVTRVVFRFLVVTVVSSLIMVITCTLHMAFTLSPTARAMDRNVQLFAGTAFAVLAFIPAPAVVIACLVPRAGGRRIEKFGSGRFGSNLALLIFSSLLLALGAGFRIGVNFSPRPTNAPAWYHHKACYYTLIYGIEIIVSGLYVAARVDKRFHVPDGAKQPGDYAKSGVPSNWESNTQKHDSSDGTVGNPRDSAAVDAAMWEQQARKELSNRDSGIV